ncbi:DUF2797 domain-containing protein [Nonomuraea sp. NPDC046570]|uniref:DUF2797 domain-containing protein n=1 Tax=Nonomuraea sp. NPDC046570 TaxID=3155255 RepID=UPI0033E727B4
MKVPLRNRRLGIRVTAPERYCTGRYGFVDEIGTELVPCPAHQPAASGGQCAQCATRDEFRQAHHFHIGGSTSSALVRYMAQPHWLYIATFADATSKVGTAAELRKRSRVDEQGAAMASYVARTSDGKVARNVEDAITRALNVPQTKRRNAKVAALAAPAPRRDIAAQHARTVGQVSELLAGWDHTAGLTPKAEPWTPPAGVDMFLDSPPAGGWARYPHDLQAGEHGFHVDACAGPAVLARTQPSDDATRFVIDLGGLKGLRITTGDFVSPESMTQSALF